MKTLRSLRIAAGIFCVVGVLLSLGSIAVILTAGAIGVVSLCLSLIVVALGCVIDGLAEIVSNQPRVIEEQDAALRRVAFAESKRTADRDAKLERKLQKEPRGFPVDLPRGQVIGEYGSMDRPKP